MCKFATTKRLRAVERGLGFIYQSACDPENFSIYGHDYLFSLHWVSSTSRDANLRGLAWDMGRERAYHWRCEHSTVPPDIDADTMTHLIFGDLSADRFGVCDAWLKPHIRKAAPLFSSQDYFWFDPIAEPPPSDVPEDCDCEASNPRGSVTCGECKQPLSMTSPYEVWLVALVRTYLGERYGVRIGARYSDVIQWLPTMRPYQMFEEGGENNFIWSIYAITHIVYTLNDYSSYKLSPRWLPEEYSFLKASLDQIIAMEDPETLGEILDSLKAFGLTDKNELISRGEEYVLRTQNSDGSWGDVNADDIYDRYHSTLTAINGLREYNWCQTTLSFPELKPLLERWAN